MQELNELERTLLEGLVNKYPSLRTHLPHLKVIRRTSVGNGLTSELGYSGFDPEADGINALFSNGEIIDVPNLKKGLAYVIDVTDGRINSIEFITYGEKWNGKISEYRILQNEN